MCTKKLVTLGKVTAGTFSDNESEVLREMNLKSTKREIRNSWQVNCNGVTGMKPFPFSLFIYICGYHYYKNFIYKKKKEKRKEKKEKEKSMYKD